MSCADDVQRAAHRPSKDDMFQARIDVFDMNETIFAELRTSVEYRQRVRNVIFVLLAALVLFSLSLPVAKV